MEQYIQKKNWKTASMNAQSAIWSEVRRALTSAAHKVLLPASVSGTGTKTDEGRVTDVPCKQQLKIRWRQLMLPELLQLKNNMKSVLHKNFNSVKTTLIVSNPTVQLSTKLVLIFVDLQHVWKEERCCNHLHTLRKHLLQIIYTVLAVCPEVASYQ